MLFEYFTFEHSLSNLPQSMPISNILGGPRPLVFSLYNPTYLLIIQVECPTSFENLYNISSAK
jgi:hypothetical protein